MLVRKMQSMYRRKQLKLVSECVVNELKNIWYIYTKKISSLPVASKRTRASCTFSSANTRSATHTARKRKQTTGKGWIFGDGTAASRRKSILEWRPALRRESILQNSLLPRLSLLSRSTVSPSCGRSGQPWVRPSVSSFKSVSRVGEFGVAPRALSLLNFFNGLGQQHRRRRRRQRRRCYTRHSFRIFRNFAPFSNLDPDQTLSPYTRPNFRLAERRMIPISSPLPSPFPPRLPDFRPFAFSSLFPHWPNPPSLLSSPLSLSLSLSSTNVPSLLRADPTRRSRTYL